jgi:alpha-mannosidase
VTVNASSPYVPEEAASGDFITEVLCIYGEGDGGEGPSEAMFQRAHTLSMLPEYGHGTVHGHFRLIEEKYGGRLPVWNDELYLENHRGTTTSQGRIKELNRKSEALILAAEKWAAVAHSLPVLSGEELLSGPKPDLDRAWKKLLFNQFHDILPGTSIPQAYVDAERDFDDVIKTCGRIRSDALQAIAGRIDTRSGDCGRDGRPGRGPALVLFNPLSWDRSETVAVPWRYGGVRVAAMDGRPIPGQVVFRDGGHRLFFHAAVPPCGYTQVRLLAGGEPALPEEPAVARLPADDGEPSADSGPTLENRFYRLEFAKNGDIARLFDKELGKELLSGPANRIRFFVNRPREWSNWNIDPDYEKHELKAEGKAAVEILDRGPVVAAVRVTGPAPEGGKVVREIRLYSDDRRIDFVTDVDVLYRESLVKAAFPFDVGAERVTTEIGYGIHERPTRPKTSFEKAKWEVWTQKWLDLSGGEGGVTVVNDSRYGFDVRGDRIRLTLVKGGIMPDPATDVGTHRIRYAIVPHAGGLREAHAWRRGYEYNFPVTPVLEDQHAGGLPREASFISCSADNVCIEVLKEAEDGKGLVLRVYEVEGRNRPEVELALPFEAASAEEVDFLELNILARVDCRGSRIVFALGHHEIKAIRVFPRKEE